MKKTLLFCLLLISSFLFVDAQGSLVLKDKSGYVISGSSFDIWGDTASSNVMSYLYDSYNAASTTKNFYKKRQVLNEVTGSENYFCWDVCYPPFVSTSPNGVNINSVATYALGSVDYKPMGFWGTTTIRYVFWDYLNPNDSSWFTIRWHAGILGMNEELFGSLLPAFPNPAFSNTQISYAFEGASNGCLRVYNMLGNLVKEIQLSNHKGSINLQVGELENGIYFYSLVANQKILSTRKLVVSR